MFRRFANDESGNIITVLGLSTLTLLGAVSAGLDYTRMTNTRAAMAAAADAAALAAAQAPPNEAAALARQVFDANFRDAAPVTAFVAEPFLKGTDQAYRVAATASVSMSLTRMMGSDARPVSTISEVMMGNDNDLLIALVLDVTGSMAGSKLASLKASASAMVNTIYTKMDQPNQVRMSVVPFAEYVNVGMANRNQPWISVPPDSSTSQNVCWMTRDVVSSTNCRQEFSTWQSCNDSGCTTQSGFYQVCDNTYGPEYQVCGTQSSNQTWAGCVGSRDYPLNVRDINYTIQPAPGVMNVSCPPPLTTLTATRTQVLAAIDSLNADGYTYIPAGLTWGWATLSLDVPFSEPVNPNKKTKRHLVLMTDGENTRSPNYPRHDWTDTMISDNLTSELCINIKAQDIEVFTIAFDVTNAAIKNRLRSCASSPDKYFDATNDTLLADAFATIARQMTQLRISR